MIRCLKAEEKVSIPLRYRSPDRKNDKNNQGNRKVSIPLRYRSPISEKLKLLT